MLLLSTCGYMFPLACHTNFLPAVGGSCYEGRCGEALRTACLSIRIIGFHRHAHLGSLKVLCLLPLLTFVVLNGKYISVFPNGHFGFMLLRLFLLWLCQRCNSFRVLFTSGGACHWLGFISLISLVASIF